MRKPDNKLSAVGLVRRIAREKHIKIGNNPEYIKYILWEHTGYPMFFQSDNPTLELRQQIEKFLDSCISGKAESTKPKEAWFCC